MGLAFNLETTLNPYLTQGLSNYFVNLPRQIQLTKVEPSPSDPSGDFFTPSEVDFAKNNGWVYRWCGKSGGPKQACQGIFPTGEYVIRDITFTNGWYAMVGAYKATFLDLYGVGNHGVAWDGFLFMYRGYSDNVLIPFDENGTINRNPVAFQGAGILPMRMPYDILPSTNSATTEAMDDVGLFSVDVWRGTAAGGEVPQPGAGEIFDAFNIQLWLGGTQGISNPVAQGIPYTNVDRIAFGMAGAFGVLSYPVSGGGRQSEVENYFEAEIGAFSTDFKPYSVVGGKVGAISFNSQANMTIKFAWNATANDTMYFDPTAPMPATGLWRTADLEDVLNIGQSDRGAGAFAYNYQEYQDGWLPNGTNIVTGATRASDTTAKSWGYYPRRFMDIAAYSAQTTRFSGTDLDVRTPCLMSGDWWIGTDDPSGASPAAKIFPGVTGMAWDSVRLNITAYPNTGFGSITQPPYMSGFVSALSFTASASSAIAPSVNVPIATQNLVLTDALVDNWNGLENAYFAFATVPYENMGQDFTAVSDNPSGRQPLLYFFANSVKYADGTIGTGIFASDFSFFNDESEVSGFAFNGQRLSLSTTDLIPITMANKWTAKCAQTRTFTVFEEENAKNFAASDEARCGFFGQGCEPQFVTNSRNGESVGIRNNFPRLGIEPESEDAEYNPILNALKQQGSPSQEAFGAMGWRNEGAGIEPVVFVADSGLGWLKRPGYPFDNPNYSFNINYSNAFQNRGITFNNKITTEPNSLSRACLGASWDNDRDQWIFLFSNFSAVVANQIVSPVSVTSTFTDTPRFGSAYLDQTQNFAGSPTAFNNAIWKSFPMTNNLDGLIAFGSTNKNFPFVYATEGVIAIDPTAGRDAPQGVYAKPTTTGNTRSFPTQSAGCIQLSDPGTISYNVSELQFWNLDGSTGRQAFVWVDYILFDGADAVIATKLRERGMKVTIDAVEWFKRKIINSGDLNIKQEEIEMWMRQQQDEFQMMMRDAERMGRVRKRKKQVSAYGLDKLEALNTDFEDKEVQEFMKSYIPQSRPPTPEEEMLERQRKGGYSPQSKSYYDEVFEN